MKKEQTCLLCKQTLTLNQFTIKKWDGQYYIKEVCGCSKAAVCDYHLLPDDTKVECNMCHEMLPFSAFSVKNRWDTVNKYCDKCRRKQAREIYQKRKELYKERAVRWRKEHPEEWAIIAHRNSQKWRRENPERYKEQQREAKRRQHRKKNSEAE